MPIPLQTQIVSSVGAAFILIAYVAHQFGRMDARGLPYNLLNVAGAGILTWVALSPPQVGFLVLEATWTVVSLYALARAFRRRTSAESH